MTFPQWRNRLKTHFSEGIPADKRRKTVVIWKYQMSLPTSWSSLYGKYPEQLLNCQNQNVHFPPVNEQHRSDVKCQLHANTFFFIFRLNCNEGNRFYLMTMLITKIISCPAQILHGLAWKWAGVSKMRGQQLAAWAIALPNIVGIFSPMPKPSSRLYLQFLWRYINHGRDMSTFRYYNEGPSRCIRTQMRSSLWYFAVHMWTDLWPAS